LRWHKPTDDEPIAAWGKRNDGQNPATDEIHCDAESRRFEANKS